MPLLIREGKMQLEHQVWKVQAEIKKYMLLSQRYVLAVSGGADSLALADAAIAVFAANLQNLLVCHVEHGIRGAEALQDAELVRAFCAHKQVAFQCCHVDVPGCAREQGISLEAAARKLRYAALTQAAQQFGAVTLVTAHQADDQAETVLWRLLRGAGSDGISGMQRESKLGDMTILRPLLALTRQDLEAYCELQHLQFCSDSTNRDVQYTRNRLRQELLPYLAKHFNPNIKQTLVREAELFAEEQACLDVWTQEFLQKQDCCGCVTAGDGKAFWVSVPKLLQLPVALRKRILRAGFFAVGGLELSYERTLALEKLCLAQAGGKHVQLGNGIWAELKHKKIYILQGVENHA